MIKVMILEDDLKSSDLLKQYIQRYSEENGAFFEVNSYSSAEQFIKNCDEKVDLLLMDIEMPGINGMTAAKMIRERNKTVIIVFVTNLAQYAIEGYAVDAYDFILKPVRYREFSMKIKRICNELEHTREDLVISVFNKGGILRLSSSNILYLEVDNHDLIIHTFQENIKIRATLASFVQLLSDKHFELCNSCYYVNLRYIKEINKDSVVVGKDSIKISQAKRKYFLQEVGKYFGGSI